jgi:RNA polymerase sigma factor (sigma-70 family)
MASVFGHRVGWGRFGQFDDERLAKLVRSGYEAAFEVLHDRHRASLLAFCRHMLGSREDGEEALQETFVRAYRALRTGRLPDAVRPWLFAIARNRCRTVLGTRRDAAMPVQEIESGVDGLAEDVQRRAQLRELVADLARLPDDQREALVLSELGDLSHTEIAATIGCPPGKVKALVFQARTALIAEREARATPCEDIRAQLEIARGGVLRRGPLRRHLHQCDPCTRIAAGAAAARRPTPKRPTAATATGSFPLPGPPPLREGKS